MSLPIRGFKSNQNQGIRYDRGPGHSRRHTSDGKGSLNTAVLCFLGFSLKELLGEEDALDEPQEDDQIVLIIKRGILAFHKGEYDRSESLLHIALKAAQEIQHEEAVTYIFDVLANLAFQRGQYDQAEKLFKSVLQRHVKAGGDVYGNTFVAVSLKLAHCYLEREDWENAVMGYHYCIGAQMEKVQKTAAARAEENNQSKSKSFWSFSGGKSPESVAPKTDANGPAASTSSPSDDEEDTLVLWAMSVEQYSRLLLRLGHYTPAREHLQQALEVCRQVHGDLHLQTAVLRNDIGSIYCMEKRFTDAISEIEEAISIVKQYLRLEEKEHREEDDIGPPKKVAAIPTVNQVDPWSNLATYHINLGSAQLLNGQRDAALSSCEEGKTLSKKASDKEVASEAAKCILAIKEAMAELAKTKA